MLLMQRLRYEQKLMTEYMNLYEVIRFFLQCCDSVGWATGRSSGLHI